MKHLFTSALILVFTTSAFGQKQKKLPDQLPDSMKVVVTKVLTSADFFRVEGYDIETKNNYLFECRNCYKEHIPIAGDTLKLAAPDLPKRKPTRRFMFN